LNEVEKLFHLFDGRIDFEKEKVVELPTQKNAQVSSAD
jgi:hypothetical protein